jgi:glycosyltransferase involved in cell wall biosynthesis
MTRVHVGIFAHNEARCIAAAIGDVAAQDIFRDGALWVRVFVLANGCDDATASVANEAVRQLAPEVAACFTVLDLPLAGKSRTWNHFVHGICAHRADVVCFVDADIRVPPPQTFSRMIARLLGSAASVVCSRPRKDIELAPGGLGWVERAILLASGTASDGRSAIAGSLYVARASALEPIWMPVGLPVEDGFLRAMVLTGLLTQAEDFSRIQGDEGIWHVYESLRTVPALVRHQTRLVIGGAVNTAVFDHLCLHAQGLESRSALLRGAASDEHWLGRMLRERLPRWPSGFVPWHFLVKRLHGWRRWRGRGAARAMLVAGGGFAFDFIVYLNAQLQMARGKGAGHW